MKKLLLTLMLTVVSSSAMAERAEVSSCSNDPKSKISECVVSHNENEEEISITLRGILAPKTAQHPVQGKFTRTVLVLEQATCFEHLESWAQMFSDCPQDCAVSYISEVQIDGPANLPDYGRPVTVTGTTSLGRTGWHLTPIMVDVDSIELLLPENENE
jgi:hypothetical protein